MQQFVVPQFIEVEDKIFGPITTRQFIILLAAGLMIFVSFRVFDTALFALIAGVIGIITIAFAFIKVNGQVFHLFLINIIQTLKRPAIRVWHKDYTNAELEMFRKEGMDQEVPESVTKKIVRKQHIRDLSLVVNTGGYYRPDDTSWE